MKNLAICLVFLLGCSSPAASERSPESSGLEIAKLETELTLNLWLHLKDEESRLEKRLGDNSLSQKQKTAIHLVLRIVRSQAQDTWTMLLKD